MRLNELALSLHDWRIRRQMERSFREDREPYRTRTSAERQRHAAVTALAGNGRFHRALDVGCAEGALTRDLAPLCDSIVALDISETAIWRAMVNLSDVPQVRFIRGNIREYLGEKGWDLIILSDVLRSLDAGPRLSRATRTLCQELGRGLVPGGRLVFLTPAGDERSYLRARTYHELFAESAPLAPRQEMIGGEGDDRFYAAAFERPKAAGCLFANAPDRAEPRAASLHHASRPLFRPVQ